MSSFGDQLGEELHDELFSSSLQPGDVFLNYFKEIGHKKFFIIVAVTRDKILTLSVFINSNIPDFIFRKPELLNLQVPIKKENNSFLKYDSFVSCNTPVRTPVETIKNWKNNNGCKVIGKIHHSDLSNITKTIIDSGLLSKEELDRFF